MRVLFVHALPFHAWVLAELREEIVRLGGQAPVYTHEPVTHEDWFVRHLHARDPVHMRIRSFEADVVVSADYPYDELRRAALAPVVATRHSLAARGNTWEQDQAGADTVVCWSDFDIGRFHAQSWWGMSPCRLVKLGCVWAVEIVRSRAPRDETPLVLWCPSWNKEFSCRDKVVQELVDLRNAHKVHIAVRPHAATAWREPAWLSELSALGFEVLDSNASPTEALARAWVLLTDVSGIGLLATCAQDGGLPVCWIDPPAGAYTLKQADITGPEWIFRNFVGPRSPQGRDLSTTLHGLMDHGGFASNRRRVRDEMIGEPEWAEGACRRTANHILDHL